MDQKPNSKSLEPVKRDGNEILKYSTSTLPCKPHCIRQQEELQVQDDNLAQAQIPVNNYEISHEVTEPKDDMDLADLRTDVANECEQIRVASRLSRLVHKHNRRNSASVKQIQDTSYRPNVLTTSKAAFTLAEVLITLAIIGVVAAITIPAIIANYQDKVLETAYKKSMSVLSNALNLAIANNGTPGDLRLTPLFSYGLPAYNKQSVSVNVNELDKNSRKLFNIMDSSLSNSFKDKMESITYDDISSILPGDVTLLGNILTPPAYAAVIELPENFQQDIWKSSEYYFVTADGIVYGYLFEKVPDYIRDVGFLVITDVNGQKAPNKAAKDLYLMAVTFSGKVNDFTCYLKNSCTDDDYKRAFGVNKIIGK